MLKFKGRKIYNNNELVAEIVGCREWIGGKPHSSLDVLLVDGTRLNDTMRGKWSYFADVVADIKAQPELVIKRGESIIEHDE